VDYQRGYKKADYEKALVLQFMHDVLGGIGLYHNNK
jgi:hypothetical protein